jgi:hypothetical protein
MGSVEMKGMRLSLTLPLLLLLPQAQTRPKAKPQTQESVAAFLARLQETLVRKNAPKSLRSFVAKTRVTIRDPKANIDIDAEISFRSPSRLRTLIREGKKTILRVYDRGRAWMQTSQGSYYLQGKEYARDRRDLRRDLSLATLILRFLKPSIELKKLKDLKPPHRVKLRFGRKAKFAAILLQGIAPADLHYPLALRPKHRGPVQVRAYFEAQSLKPLQIELGPMDPKTKKLIGLIERYRFHSHALKNGLILPTQLSLLSPDSNGKYRVVQKVQILQFDLNPDLPKALFKKS